LFTGCAPSEPSPDDTPFEIVLQTDWFPQPEHGGFYQALAKGYYEEAGLNVTILPGGPNAMSTQKVLKGRAHFAMNRADTIHSLTLRDVPVIMVMATLQHDPQALMLHSTNPIDSFEELDGQQVMAIPGLAWIRWIEATYGIELEIIPHDFGMERFINDPDFIQQCLLTNEPFYVRQAGVEPKVLPLRDSGFDPYHGIYCLKTFADSHPDEVRRFVQASVRGWRDFILNDPAPAFALIAARNPKMSPEFMEFSYQTLKRMNLVTGDAPDGQDVGSLDPERMNDMVDELRRIGLVGESAEPDPEWFTTRFLVRPAGEPVDELP
jgi:NitT/TauT family transport system substrate-binding protein